MNLQEHELVDEYGRPLATGRNWFWWDEMLYRSGIRTLTIEEVSNDDRFYEYQREFRIHELMQVMDKERREEKRA